MQNPPPVSMLFVELLGFSLSVQQALALAKIDWQQRPSPDQWSLTEVICHLRDVEREVHQPRFQTLLAKEDAFLPGMTPDEWAKERGYQAQNGRDALKDFVRARGETAELLTNIDDALWQRSGNHAFFGQTTMHELLYLVVQHDRVHWQQIIRLGSANE
jgi:hypothetical protein